MNFSKIGDALKDVGQSVGKAVEDYGKNVATNAKAIVVRPQPKAAPADSQVAPVPQGPMDEREELINLSRGSPSQSPVHGYHGVASPNNEPQYQHDLENGLQPRK
jgi:hypothetical protein